MSYDISLIDPVTRERLVTDTPHDIRGGTYVVGGTKELWLNVTYNYSALLNKVLVKTDEEGNVLTSGIDVIHGLTGAESIGPLTHAAAQLSDEGGDAGYWTPTEGNVKRILLQLKAMAQVRPDGIWEVS